MNSTERSPLLRHITRNSHDECCFTAPRCLETTSWVDFRVFAMAKNIRENDAMCYATGRDATRRKEVSRRGRTSGRIVGSFLLASVFLRLAEL